MNRRLKEATGICNMFFALMSATEQKRTDFRAFKKLARWEPVAAQGAVPVTGLLLRYTATGATGD